VICETLGTVFTTRPLLRGTFGMVSSTHWLASQCGMAVLEKGGNAFDAAVAAGLVLQVVEPHMNGLGGDASILIWSQREQRAHVVCGQGPAPADAAVPYFEQLGLEMIPGSGLLAACVPGAFGAWMAILREHGIMQLREVMEYAISYAETGYPLAEPVASVIASVAPLFRSEWTESASVYLGHGVPKPGALFRNRDLATTYRRILAEAEHAGGGRETQIDAAVRSFHEGFIAEAIERHCGNARMDSSGTRHRGLLTGSDLAGWRAPFETPVSTTYRDWTLFKTGPWGQGPVFLQQLRLLQGYNLAGMRFLGDDYVHTIVECAKLAFADRDAWYGDPAFVDVPLTALLDGGYSAGRRELIAAEASYGLRPGTPGGLEPKLPTWAKATVAPGHATGAGDVQIDHSVSTELSPGDTCHVDVADRFGNLVAATPSGGWLQSSPVIPGLGFCLGTRAQMFNLCPGLPNSLAGGKRPRTTLTPTLAFHGDTLRLAFGSPGGDQQDQWSLNFFLAVADYGYDLQEAIDAPAFHTEHFPSSFAPHEAFPGHLSLESRISTATSDALKRRGHDVRLEEPWSLGRMCAVGNDSGSGQLVAAANPRGMQGYAVGR
jgi:gamma-glutamyltranspeptidase/glutathione hydrolase